ncbi:C1 protein [Zinnia leaf curl virus-associated DNA beta]|uniref:C1 protein n=1 Tax=Zinnia leaf curl virus-associated DNA beta TaxID=220813 RepID=Q70UF1_9VIRU|nr:C1 protein [Zinnia leaf curl virus-associated DNA beta]CAD65762.1 C1 protein [Zinnia leaf curl virus-associated DNA beta]
MTIKYSNKKGMSFIIDVRLRTTRRVSVEIDLFSTTTPFLHKQRYIIPYGHQGLIGPFDFNGLEESIKNIFKVMYEDSPTGGFKAEDMIELVDILMMQEAHVIEINLDEEYKVSKHTSV